MGIVFQLDAFQNDAFQIIEPTPDVFKAGRSKRAGAQFGPDVNSERWWKKPIESISDGSKFGGKVE